MKDLTASNIERQNVLNNRYAVEGIQKRLHVSGMLFDGEYRFTKKMVADFYAVDTSTIDRYLASNGDELKHNGYVLCKGKQLKEFKLHFAHLINEASKTTQVGLFNFRAFLDIGMLLTGSEKAKEVRSIILVFRFCSGHFFYDGNKRIALTSGAYFLHKNNHPWEACIFMRQFEAIVYHIAASHIDQDLFLRIMQAFIARRDYDEELKIAIANAMSQGDFGIKEEYRLCAHASQRTQAPRRGRRASPTQAHDGLANPRHHRPTRRRHDRRSQAARREQPSEARDEAHGRPFLLVHNAGVDERRA